MRAAHTTLAALGLLVLLAGWSGCASSKMSEAGAPAADKADPEADDMATRKAKPAPGEGVAGLSVRDQVIRPDVLVARLGKRWGLPLDRIAPEPHRRRVAGDLQWLEQRRAKIADPPPGRSWLFVCGPGVYAVLVLPTTTRQQAGQHASLYLWDFGADATACRVSLTTRPADGGALARRRPVIRRGALWVRDYRLGVTTAGAFAIRLVVDRGPGRVLLRRDHPVPVASNRPDQ